jgi:hypothetical protein
MWLILDATVDPLEQFGNRLTEIDSKNFSRALPGRAG